MLARSSYKKTFLQAKQGGNHELAVGTWGSFSNHLGDYRLGQSWSLARSRQVRNERLGQTSPLGRIAQVAT